MKTPYFFGYGSLVNTATHSYQDPRPARLTGWQRTWAHTELRDVAFLTAIQIPGGEIDGLIAAVPNADWEALDAREYAYDRLPTREISGHDLPDETEISVYAVAIDKQKAVTPQHPILLSYLDVVLQGYHQVFGKEGVADFMATTSGWEASILNDRDAPIYPRHQQLTRAERDLVDRCLADINANILSA